VYADARADVVAREALEAVEHLTRRDRQAWQVHRAPTAE
jgi:hypothetical protein